MTASARADLDSEWQRKGATLSDKTVRKEFGLTQDEIVRVIRARKLQYGAKARWSISPGN